MIAICFLFLNISWQGDWVGGPGIAGPITDWTNKFYQSDSVTFNIQGQISPIASGTPNYTNWTKRVIDFGSNIGYNAIWPADFDGDSVVDVAGWKSVGGVVAFYKNTGNTFTQMSTAPGPSGGYWCFMFGADFDNDGKQDVVVTGGEANGGGLSWYKNNGGFSFTRNIISSDTFNFFVEGADIDKDGFVDLGVTKAFKASVKIWRNNGNGTFSLWQNLGAYDAWRLKFGDLNNDGYPDLVIGDGYSVLSSDVNFKIFLNDGTGHFNYVTNVANGATSAGNDGLWIRDVNNDGKNDIITAVLDDGTYPTSIAIYWFENDGTGVNYTQHTVYPGGNVFYGDGGFAEDLDFDGKADIPTGFIKLSWFRQNNPNSWTEYIIDQPSNTYTHWIVPFQTHFGQCFQSNKINLLVCWRDSATGYFSWYENNMISGFVSSASLQSSVLRTVECDTTTWLYFGWKTCCPFNNAINFRFRTGNSYAGITSAAWSSPVAVTTSNPFDSIALASYVQNNKDDSLFQYKIDLIGAADAGIIDSVWVTWHCGIAGVEEKDVVRKEGIDLSADKIMYSLLKDCYITLSLYDVSGRMVKLLDAGKRSPGEHSISIPKIPKGVYLVLLKTATATFSKKLTVVK